MARVLVKSIAVPAYNEATGTWTMGLAGNTSNSVVVVNNGYITSSTSDAADNKSMTISGGGGGTAWNQNRGAGIVMQGNEVSGAEGEMVYYAGNAGGTFSRHRWVASGINIGLGSKDGAFTFGPENGDNLSTTHIFRSGDASTGAAGSRSITIVRADCISSSLSSAAVVVGNGTSQFGIVHERGLQNYIWIRNTLNFAFTSSATIQNPITGMTGYLNLGSVTTSAAWTFADIASISASIATFGGDSLENNGNEAVTIRTIGTGTSARATLAARSGGSLRWRIGSSLGTGFMTNSSPNDFCIQTNSQAIFISTDNGTTAHAIMSSTGGLTIGATAGITTHLINRKLKFQVQSHTTTTTETALSILSTHWRFDLNANIIIQGIAAGEEGRIVYLSNNGTGNVTLAYNSGSAAAADRLNLQGNQDKIVPPNGSIGLIYQGARWNTVGSVDQTASGTYAPAISSTSNIAANNVFDAQYMRVGNVVTVSGYISLTPTASGTQTSFELSLPIASALTSAAQLGGTFVQEGGSAGVAYCPGNIQGSAANDKATFIYSPTHTVSRILTYTYTYLVLS